MKTQLHPAALLPRRMHYRMHISLLSLLTALALATTHGAGAQGSGPAFSPKPAFDATRLTVPLDLDGVWRIHGDDNPSFASPNFDDSNWTQLDILTPLPAVLHGARPQIIWYRLAIQVDPKQTGIALREESLARAFEVYVNGELLMTSGHLNPFSAYTYSSQILAPIPDRMVATGHLVIALRIGFADLDWNNEFPGLSAGNLTLGAESALADKDWLEVIGENFASLLDSVLTVALGLVALALFVSLRRHREYLWIFGLGMMRLAELPVQILCLFHNIPIGWRFFNAAFTVASPFLWTAMYFAFVNRRIGWKFNVFLWIAGVFNAYSNLVSQGLAPTLPGSYGLLNNVLFVFLLAAVIPVILAVDWRRGNREAGILLIPATLFSLYIYANYALALLLQVPAWKALATNGLNLIQRFPAGPFAISLNNVSGILCTTSLAVIMVLRYTNTSQRQAQLESELAAAREVQQVILPENFEAIPGFEVESIYQPARQVGGDFFQVIPAKDGGLLLVLGDVAGKGLPAAMLVSVLVGAIRATAEFTQSPAALLASLNERLIGRSQGGFSTALAAHFSSNGTVTIANAGHLSPYIDGHEIALPGALPLGILSGVLYESSKFHLASGSRITFYSDGVIEAQSLKGELFGFERGEHFSIQPAATIAEAATQFGQNDDITVVAIRRSALSLAAD